MYRIITENDIKHLFKKREKDCNKGNFGYVGVMGGCLAYSGAVKLSNMAQNFALSMASLPQAALRSGCGVSRLIVPDSISKGVVPFLLESTLFEMPSDEKGYMFLPDEIDSDPFLKLKALAVGMGWGVSDNYFKILEHILNNLSLNLVIDADGLNTLAKIVPGSDRRLIEILPSTKCNVVLTPHLTEFSRLCEKSVEEIKEDRINISEEFAKKYKCILLLKGSETIVTDGFDTVICDRGDPGMATAGSGDVLSGILAGLLGYLPATVETVAAGAFINGVSGELASEEFGEISMTAGDTVSKIPQVMKNLVTQE